MIYAIKNARNGLYYSGLSRDSMRGTRFYFSALNNETKFFDTKEKALEYLDEWIKEREGYAVVTIEIAVKEICIQNL